MTIHIVSLLVGLVLGVVGGWLAWGRGRSDTAPGREVARGDGTGNGDGWGAGDPDAATANAPARVSDVAASIAPLNEAVGRLGAELRGMDRDRAATMAALTSQVQAMTRTSTRLSDRTDRLVASLRSPQVRGRWGEMQLSRVVELGGMVEHCDFDTQVTARVEGKLVKPDMVVHLAGGRSIVVDAKVPYAAYLDALETDDPEEHAAFLRRHAHQLRSHVVELARREYVAAFSPTPEFVVLFVPADPFLDSALQVDPEILEYGMANSVVIATPTTLFALLRTVALGWRQEDFSDKAREIHRLGRQPYPRLGTLNEHYAQVGRALDRTVEAYNSTLGSLDSRVGVTARRLAEMGVPARTDREVRDPQPATRPRPASVEGGRHGKIADRVPHDP